MSKSNHLDETSALAIAGYQEEQLRLFQRVFARHYPGHLYLRLISRKEIEKRLPVLRREYSGQVWGAFNPEDDSLVATGADLGELVEQMRKRNLLPIRVC